MHPCPQHADPHHSNNPTAPDTQISYTVRLLLQHFVSPYKILHKLDANQADKFKARNGGKGCCVNRLITIPRDQMTQTQKWLSELITCSHLTLHLNAILSLCAQKHRNIAQRGKQDQLEADQKVDKFILDKVLAECINQLIYQQLAEKVTSKGASLNKEIGLWATPATWLQRYPQAPLDTLPNLSLSELLGRGWSVVPMLFKESINLLREMKMLQIDGRYEDSPWIAGEKTKILDNPETFSQLKNKQEQALYPSLNEALLTISSFPFEFNLKANLFCTISPNLHLCYSKAPCQSQFVAGQLHFTVLLPVSTCLLQVGSQQLTISAGDICIIDNSKHPHRLSCSGGQPLFLVRNYIGTVDKK